MQKYKHMTVWVLALAGILLAVNLCFDLCCYKNYNDKIEILEQMASSDEQSKLDIITSLLKNEEPQDRPADAVGLSAILKQYGYDNGFQDQYYRTFLRQCAAVCVCTVIVMAVVLSFLGIQKRRWYQIQERYFMDLEQCLIRFRENQDTGQDMPQMADAAEGLEYAVMRINDQFVMLAEYLTMMREQSFAEKEETKSLVTDISHQLKTPVAALDTCFSVIMEQDLSREEREEFYHRCRDELEGLKALLDSLIQISRMEAGMIQIKCQGGLIWDTILAAVNRIYPKASDKQQELVFDYAPEIEQLVVEHDAQWLCEAFINVLDNAVKYSPAGSEICVAVKQFCSFVRVEIIDQGIGIPKQERHKVFQRFYRGSSRQVRRENGSGVGLYLARKIVSSHHGVVSVSANYKNNKETAGCRFIIQLPLS